MNKITRVLLTAFCFSFFIVQSNIRLPKLISNGAVFQRDTELKIWGWAAPGEPVELTFKGSSYTTKTAIDGHWSLILPPQPAGGPYTMLFKGSNNIVLNNILFGEVWLCSGQSNMELNMHRLKDRYPEIIKNYQNDKIRQFVVSDRYHFQKPLHQLEQGSWKEASHLNLAEFSGVAFFFAKDMFEKFGVPIGLINSAVGGSPVEAWMSEEALKEFPVSYKELQQFKNSTFVDDLVQGDKDRQQDWYQTLLLKDQGLKNGEEWYLESLDDSDWKPFEIPNYWNKDGFDYVNGSMWFRKEIFVPKSMLGKKAKLWLGRIVDQDHVYVNEKYVGTTGYQYPPRKYTLENNVLKEGRNTLAIRVINEKGAGGFVADKPYFLAVGNDTIALKTNWKIKLGARMLPLQGPTFVRWKPGGLYNAMIAPLLNYKIKGVLWYQGESNTSNPKNYQNTFTSLIKDWRKQWAVGEFPFLFVQLSNFMKPTETPSESNWAALRQQQLESLSMSNTGMAVTIDLGEWNDIHPQNKQDVGNRLAQLAYRLAYHYKDASTSAVPKKQRFLKNKVKLWFDYDAEGLISKNGEAIKYFEISNDGLNYHKANTKIKGSKIIVWNTNVELPIAVRYAWSNNPSMVNLYSNNGLPVSPFQVLKTTKNE